MFGAILKATNSSFQKGMTCCRSIYVKKVMKVLAFIFEQPSYLCHMWNSLLLKTHTNFQYDQYNWFKILKGIVLTRHPLYV